MITVILKQRKQGAQLDCVTDFYTVFVLFTDYNSLYDNNHAVLSTVLFT